MTQVHRLATALLFLVPAGIQADDEPTTLRLPARYDASAFCGSGRYLAMRLADGAGVVVVDLAKRTIAREIKTAPKDALLAGGRDVLLLVSPGQRLIQRYRVGNFERDKVAALPYDGELKAVRLGCAGTGPLLLGGTEAVLVDVESLKPLEIEEALIGAWDRYGYTLRVSADGRTFTGIPNGYGPVAYTRMVVGEDGVAIDKFGSTSHANRWAQPTANGYLTLTPGGGLYDIHLQPARVEWLNETTCFPTPDPAYFLSVKFVARDQGGFDTHLSVCGTADRRVLHTVVGLREMVPHGNTNSRNGIARRLVYGEERYHWVPETATLVTRPYDDTSLVFRSLTEEDVLGDSNVVVDSFPPSTVRAGTTVEYPFRTRSRSRKVRTALVDGPEGMTFRKKSTLRWKVPEQAEPGMRTIVVSVTAGKEESFHTFRVNVVGTSE